jgi:hypothetical protein
MVRAAILVAVFAPPANSRRLGTRLTSTGAQPPGSCHHSRRSACGIDLVELAVRAANPVAFPTPP